VQPEAHTQGAVASRQEGEGRGRAVELDHQLAVAALLLAPPPAGHAAHTDQSRRSPASRLHHGKRSPAARRRHGKRRRPPPAHRRPAGQRRIRADKGETELVAGRIYVYRRQSRGVANVETAESGERRGRGLLSRPRPRTEEEIGRRRCARLVGSAAPPGGTEEEIAI
jgi:hypothetical protein